MDTRETSARINFHFDPICPLSWRTALWMRQVRMVRPVDIQWRLFSLEVLNRKAGVEPDYVNGLSWTALRTLAQAYKQDGNDARERLYLALGNAAHGRNEDIGQYEVVVTAANEAKLAPGIVDAALADEGTIQMVLSDHEEAVRRYHAFCVPTIAFEGSDVGFYGPIIHNVPQGERAGELWDHISWMLHQPNLFELKRDRSFVQWDPVTEEALGVGGRTAKRGTHNPSVMSRGMGIPGAVTLLAILLGVAIFFRIKQAPRTVIRARR
jgi:predicted DsbA family dithiol-disulfide isomerase